MPAARARLGIARRSRGAATHRSRTPPTIVRCRTPHLEAVSKHPTHKSEPKNKKKQSLRYHHGDSQQYAALPTERKQPSKERAANDRDSVGGKITKFRIRPVRSPGNNEVDGEDAERDEYLTRQCDDIACTGRHGGSAASNGEVDGPPRSAYRAPRAHTVLPRPRRVTTDRSRTPSTIVRCHYEVGSIHRMLRTSANQPITKTQDHFLGVPSGL